MRGLKASRRLCGGLRWLACTLSLCAAIAGSAYVVEVMLRVSSIGGAHLDSGVLGMMHALPALAAVIAVPALRAERPALRRMGLLSVVANCAALSCWSVLTLGGWVVSHEAMMRGSAVHRSAPRARRPDDP